MSSDNHSSGRSVPLERDRQPAIWIVIVLILCCSGIELLLQASDAGWMASRHLRRICYDFGAFWPGLLSGWRPNYSAQPLMMFLTYGLLHGGLAHLLVNMMTLWSLGREVIARVGAWGFALTYLGAQLGGAAMFGLLAPPVPPMVGASGALFGLAGALLAWNYVDRFSHHRRLWPVANMAFWLVVLNLVLWWAMDGQLAWETHLGGFLAGWVMALLVDPRPQKTLQEPSEPD